MVRLRLIVLGVVCLHALFYFPPFSDGALAVHDGWAYGVLLDMDTLAASRANHAAFHPLSQGIARVLRAAGIPDAGPYAVRVLSGLGAALTLLLVARFAGLRARGTGMAFAAASAAFFGFTMQAASGETIFTGCAAALWAIDLALRERPHLGKVGFALVVAMCFRQDNLLIVPGVLAALDLPPEHSVRRRVVLLVATGTATALAFFAYWLAFGGQEGLVTFVLGLGSQGSFERDGAVLPTEHLATYAEGLGIMFTGKLTESPLPQVLIGVGACALLLVAGRLLRGDAPVRRLAIACGSAIVLRFAFFWWFHPFTWEYHVLGVYLVLALAAGMARGTAVTGRAARTAGGTLLLLLAITSLAAHGPTTLALRNERLLESVKIAQETGGPEGYFLVHGFRAQALFMYLGIDFQKTAHDPDQAYRDVLRYAPRSRGKTIVISDVFALDGMPHSLRKERSDPLLSSLQRIAPIIVPIEHAGRVFAVQMKR